MTDRSLSAIFLVVHNAPETILLSVRYWGPVRTRTAPDVIMKAISPCLRAVPVGANMVPTQMATEDAVPLPAASSLPFFGTRCKPNNPTVS